ncbi:MAG: hypothetical protein RLZZ585_1330 [Bacteroidota bacterium]|jgi:hypothetical protein
MKTIFLLLSLTWLETIFAQVPEHFLITSNSSVRITDPICKKMAEDSKTEIQEEIKRLNQKQKKGDILFKNMPLEQQSYFEAIKTLGDNPEIIFAPYSIADALIRTYRQTVEEPIYLSLQKVSLKSLGEVTLEISINDIQVSSSESAMDVVVKSLKNPNTPAQTIHFSCPTGRLLLDNGGFRRLAWMNFWGAFFQEVKAMEQLEKIIMQVDPTLVSVDERNRQIDETLKNLGLTSKEYLSKGTEQARNILKDIPYQIPFNQIIGVFISKDEQKLSLLSGTSKPEIQYDEEHEEGFSYLVFESKKWNFEKKDGNWHMYYPNGHETDSLATIRSFYNTGIDSDKRLLEENWMNENESENLSDIFNHIEFVHEKTSIETETLVQTQIQPKLAKLFSEKNSTYDNFYQRISQQTTSYWDEQYTEKLILKDVLISNPEKTAFIFPVILNIKDVQNEDVYYSSNEDFKFYVLLKNPDGNFTLYDWYYFKPLSYWSNYSLLRCAETHLKHISNFTEDQETINDEAFWDNYIFKKSARGYEYLTQVISTNESISISKSEFDAQVQDCINILLEYDVVDLYEHQLKQILRCINTIQKEKLTGVQNTKLITLSQDLHFQKRLNKIRTADKNYYPQLNLEYGEPMTERSFYLIH